MSKLAVELENVDFKWTSASNAPASGFSLNGIDFRLGCGDSLFLHGPSGSGKSTLLGLMCGTLSANSGAIRVLGTDLATIGTGNRDRFRADHIGVIFQLFNLVPYLSVLDNILLPLSFAPARKARIDDKDPADSAAFLLKRLGFEPGEVIARKPSELSVGQQQRVAAARAFIGSPELIIADEPTSALDTDLRDNFIELMLELAGESNAALLMVSHDKSLAHHFGSTRSMSEIIGGSR